MAGVWVDEDQLLKATYSLTNSCQPHTTIPTVLPHPPYTHTHRSYMHLQQTRDELTDGCVVKQLCWCGLAAPAKLRFHLLAVVV